MRRIGYAAIGFKNFLFDYYMLASCSTIRSAGMAVAEGVVGPRHRRIMVVVVEEAEGLLDDPVAVGAEPGAPFRRLDTLGALGGLAHHQDRFAERRRLLLDAARIGQHDIGQRQQADEIGVVLRGDQLDARMDDRRSERTSATLGLGRNGSTMATSSRSTMVCSASAMP